MPIKKELLKKYRIGTKSAARHAATHMHMGIFTNTPGLAAWRGANLGESTMVYDLNGYPLFYDFPVVSPQHEQIGLIRTSANRVLGAPVSSMYIGGPRWDAGKATIWAEQYVRTKLKGSVLESKLVCYAYPKLGILVQWKNSKGEPKRIIVDIGDYTLVPENVEPNMRGPGAISVYDSMTERKIPSALKTFSAYSRVVNRLQRRSRLDLADSHKLEASESIQHHISVIIPWFTTKIISFCTHGDSHECFHMHGQETDYWCVVATGQMILDFWRYYHSQNDIATAMGTGTGGTSYTGEVNGLESLTCNHFDASSDMSPTFTKAKAQIDANRPFDYSYSYHAMACAGYRQQNIYIFGTTPENSVYLYDPWPPNVGTIRWEVWGAGISSVDGFVYLTRS
jgi:hypothetical protein